MSQPLDIKPLTALRFYAAMWVVLYHYWSKLEGAAPVALISRGYLGVELFFVLSGFILAHVYLPQIEAGRFRYGGFLWARLARIYPLHLATLAGVIALGLTALAAGFQIDPTILTWQALPANLALLQAWGLAPAAAFNHPSWSISAEWFAYLSFPAFAVVALPLRHRPGIAVAGALALLASLYLAFPLVAGFDLTQATIAWGALRIVPCFALGCAIDLLWRHRPIADARWAVGLSVALVAAILALAQFKGHDVLLTGVFGFLILCLASLTSTGSRLGTSALGVWLGEISFAIYMVCIPWELVFVNGAGKLLGIDHGGLPPLLWLVFFVSVIPVAAAAHHLVERPARTVMKTWAERRRAVAAQFA